MSAAISGSAAARLGCVETFAEVIGERRYSANLAPSNGFVVSYMVVPLNGEASETRVSSEVLVFFVLVLRCGNR
jgi:hypothetical protein